MVGIAFKEWALVDRALGAGRQTILIRKGGIHERHGRFEVEHVEFLVYPTQLHQKLEAIKPADRLQAATEPQPGPVLLRHFVHVIEVFRAEQTSVANWDAFHVYSPQLIASRFAYKPDRPLYVLLVRVFRLPAPVAIRETPQYAGCRSWLTLTEPIDVRGAAPVMGEDEFAGCARRIRHGLARTC